MRLADGVVDRARRVMVRRVLSASMYPTPHAELRRPMWRRVLTPVVAIVLATGAQLIRLTGAQVLNTVWAEDGAVFLRDAYNRPFSHALFHTYAGYLHVVPRLLAELASDVPAKDASIVMSGGSALLVAMLSVVVFRASRDVISSTLVRVALAASMVVLPATALETLDNAANLHWYLMFAAFWVLLWRPTSRTERVVACMVVAAAALCDPLSVVLAPVALARWIALPHRGERAVTIAYGTALAVQLAFAVGAQSNPLHVAPGVLSVSKVFGLRVAAASILGDQITNRLFLTWGWTLAWLGGAAVIAIVVFGVRRWNSRWVVVALAVLASAAVFFIPMTLRWEPSLIPIKGADALGGGSRYMVVPVLLLISAFLVIADQAGQRWRNAPVAGVVAAALVFGWGPGFLVRNERSLGPTWRTGITQAKTRCPSTGGTVRVPIPPQLPKGRWVVPVPCDRLR
ncbi:MAG: hypothetical protein JO054_05125 [Actinobacteria bacterium]|nr:hypothetical protein [Actinomycetota bacterium]